MTMQWPGIKILEKVNHIIPQWNMMKPVGKPKIL